MVAVGPTWVGSSRKAEIGQMAAFHRGTPQPAMLEHWPSPRPVVCGRATVLGTGSGRAHVTFLRRHRGGKATMASGWAKDAAVQDQIDDTVNRPPSGTPPNLELSV